MRSAMFFTLALLCAAPTLTQALEVKGSMPDFTIIVPGLPDMSVTQQPADDATGTARMAGDNGTYKVLVVATRSARPVTARECAGTLLRAIVARPGMPPRDDIYRAPLSERTFLVIYVLQNDGQPVLHAHLLASVSGAHCVEAHLSRAARAGEDDDEWRNAFVGARIDDGEK